jgi:hypothetical protein
MQSTNKLMPFEIISSFCTSPSSSNLQGDLPDMKARCLKEVPGACVGAWLLQVWQP